MEIVMEIRMIEIIILLSSLGWVAMAFLFYKKMNRLSKKLDKIIKD